MSRGDSLCRKKKLLAINVRQSKKTAHNDRHWYLLLKWGLVRLISEGITRIQSTRSEVGPRCNILECHSNILQYIIVKAFTYL